MATEPVDALVIFGATGDLAKLETFPALVGLVERGVLDVPVVGVAKSGWGLDAVPRLRRRVPAPQRHRPEHAGGREAARAAALRRRGPRRRRDLRRDVARDGRRAAGRCSTSRCRRRCSAGSPQGIAAAGRADGARVMVEKPFGTDLASAQALNATMHEVLPRGRHLPGRPLARPGPAGERAVRPVRQLGARAAAQPRPRGEHPDHDGRGVRRRRPRPLLRPDRRDPRRRAEPHAAGARHRARRPAGRRRLRLLAGRQGAGGRLARAAATREDAVRGQYEGYHDVDGVDPGSTTETLRRGPARRGLAGAGPACRS